MQHIYTLSILGGLGGDRQVDRLHDVGNPSEITSYPVIPQLRLDDRTF